MSKKNRSELVTTSAPTVEATPEVVTPVETPVTTPEPCPAVLAASPWVAADGADKPLPPNPHTGRYSGHAIEVFQNRVFAMNAGGEFRSLSAEGVIRSVGLTDYQLAILFAVEHPESRCVRNHGGRFPAHYVASTRTAWVNGRHPSVDPAVAELTPAVAGRTYGTDGLPASKPYRGPAK